MKQILLVLLLGLLSSLPCTAQSGFGAPDAPLKGTFYVSVDDAVKLYVNGNKVYEAGIGESRSPELELKAGDRVVAELRNDGDGRHFFLIFATTDKQTVVSFSHADFKIIPDIDVTDFTPEQFQKWPKHAKEERMKKSPLPIKSYSEMLWGDMDKCIIGAVVTPGMIRTTPK